MIAFVDATAESSGTSQIYVAVLVALVAIVGVLILLRFWLRETTVREAVAMQMVMSPSIPNTDALTDESLNNAAALAEDGDVWEGFSSFLDSAWPGHPEWDARYPTTSQPDDYRNFNLEDWDGVHVAVVIQTAPRPRSRKNRRTGEVMPAGLRVEFCVDTRKGLAVQADNVREFLNNRRAEIDAKLVDLGTP